jgi:hypothetical protein
MLKELLPLKILRGLSRLKRLKGYSTMNRQELFDNYNRYLSVILIQQKYRKYLYHDAVDHITLENVKFPCFIFQTKAFKLYFYSYESIIKYIMKSGNTSDPMTRSQYSDEDLIRIDIGVKRYFPECRYRSALRIKNHPEYAMRIRNRENEILSYELRIDEIKNNLLILTSINASDWDITNILIDNHEYSNIQSYQNQLIYELHLVLRNLNRIDSNLALNYKHDIVLEFFTPNRPELLFTN